MGAAVGTGGGKGSVNVELNIVPFIDLMSCLTAFLLVTAVWVDIAQLNIQPKGKNRDTQVLEVDEEPVNLSVLVTADEMWIGLSRIGTSQKIQRGPVGFDWKKYEAIIKTHKSEDFPTRVDMEIAAESTKDHVVHYQDLITAMDIAHHVGFSDVALSDPMGL